MYTGLDTQYRLSFPVDRHDVQRRNRQINLTIKVNTIFPSKLKIYNYS